MYKRLDIAFQKRYLRSAHFGTKSETAYKSGLTIKQSRRNLVAQLRHLRGTVRKIRPVSIGLALLTEEKMHERQAVRAALLSSSPCGPSTPS